MIHRAKPRTFSLIVALSLSAVILILLAARQPTTAAGILVNRKLSGDMQPDGDVVEYALSPDNRYAVFRADAERDGTYELYSVPTTGGADPTRLNAPLPEGGGIAGFIIAPNSGRVVYVGSQDAANIFELYSVPIGGGQPTKLNGPLPFGGNVSPNPVGWEISPDSGRVVYLADQDTNDVLEIYSVSITGGGLVKLNEELPEGGLVTTADISPDSRTVVFRANMGPPGAAELYSAPIDGGESPVLLSLPVEDGGDVFLGLAFTPDSERVVYRGRVDEDSQGDYFSVPVGGGEFVQLSGPMVAGGGVTAANPTITNDGNTVVYLADQETVGAVELYSVPVTGGEPVKLNGPLVAGGRVIAFRVNPESDTAFYRAEQDEEGVGELYWAPIDGGQAQKITPPMAPGGGGVLDAALSHDGKTAVYRAEQNEVGVYELFSVPSTGGAAVKLNGPLVEEGDVWPGYAVTPDGAWVVFRADDEVEWEAQLFMVPINGGEIVRLSQPLVEGGQVWSFRISNDSRRIVYWADQDTAGQDELYVTFNSEVQTMSYLFLPVIGSD